MKSSLPLVALLILASAPSGAATGVSRTYSVTTFDRVRVDGPYQVSLHTGVAPFARASGKTNAALDSVSVRTEGRTLIVSMNRSGWGGYPGEAPGPVSIEVGTHDLVSAAVNGPGSLSIDKAKGLSFDVTVVGAGVASVDQLAVDQLKVAVAGSGTARINGKAMAVTAVVRGSSNLDGSALSTKDAVIGAEGPSLVKMTVTGTAKIDAMGLTSVTLTGKPSCTVKAQGSATVAGCK